MQLTAPVAHAPPSGVIEESPSSGTAERPATEAHAAALTTLAENTVERSALVHDILLEDITEELFVVRARPP